MAERKVNEKNGIYIAVTLIILLIFAIWLFAFNGVQQLKPSSARETLFPSFKPTPVNETHKFLKYNSEEWGFSLQYPQGLIVEEPVEDTAVFRAHASMVNSMPEIIEVLVDNSTTTTAQQQFNEIIAEQSTGVASTFTNANGVATHLVKTVTSFPALSSVSNSTFTIYQATYNCERLNEQREQYVAMVMVIIPQELTQDLPVADYVVNNFKC
ncbi:MAG: hypothetical protein V1722_04765 [Candidatus Micrarchaeota archaeon]